MLNRIERQLNTPGLVDQLAGLSPTDLQSLLLEVYRQQAARRTPAAVLADHETDRFARPSTISPLDLLRWEQTAFAHLPEGFQSLALSPVCTLGTNSAIALVDQNRVMSTIYNTEVVSDSTNVLALQAALQRRTLLKANPKSNAPVHLAASHRLLRTQRYTDPLSIAHFNAFALCSAGRDQGRQQFELDSFTIHLSFYLGAIPAFVPFPTSLKVAITDFKVGSQPSPFIDQLFARLHPEFPQVEFTIDPTRTSGRDYYADLCFHVYAALASGTFLELADGGLVNWTQRLLSNAKERCTISGLGSERLISEFVP
jgi:hypothetical protein